MFITACYKVNRDARSESENDCRVCPTSCQSRPSMSSFHGELTIVMNSIPIPVSALHTTSLRRDFASQSITKRHGICHPVIEPQQPLPPTRLQAPTPRETEFPMLLQQSGLPPVFFPILLPVRDRIGLQLCTCGFPIWHGT